MSKVRLQVSVSGGRTSAYMAHWLLTNRSDDFEFMFAFANTGLEHPDTYRFLDDVDKHLLDGRLVRLEAVVTAEKGTGTKHRIVSHTDLARDGRPYKDVIAKFGIPSSKRPHCTRELKLRVLDSYARSLWSSSFERAIGIRVDEARRVSKAAIKERIHYPLVDWHPTTKQDVLDWFGQFPWDLKIPEYLGNCVSCFKKSDQKLNAVWWDDPAHFDFFKVAEETYGDVAPEKYHGEPLRFFRGFRSTQQMLDQFREWSHDNRKRWRADEEDAGSCSESCEPFPMAGEA